MLSPFYWFHTEGKDIVVEPPLEAPNIAQDILLAVKTIEFTYGIILRCPITECT